MKNPVKPKKEEWVCSNCLGRDGCMCALKPKVRPSEWEKRLKNKWLEGDTLAGWEAFIAQELTRERKLLLQEIEKHDLPMFYMDDEGEEKRALYVKNWNKLKNKLLKK